MQLSLSSTAAPDASLEELLAGCTRRGLGGLELSEGDGHALSLSTSPGAAAAMADYAREAGVSICAIQVASIRPDELDAAARLAAAVEAPVIVPLKGFDRAALPRAADAFAARGARLLLAHGSDARVHEAARWLLEPLPGAAAVGLAWDVRPGVDEPARIGDVLDAAGEALRYIRLHGGGPESQAQTGQGVGALLATLALRRYAGPLVLTPSTPSYRYVWSAWLGRAGGWGCGSKQSDETLVTLDRSAYAIPEHR
jgi:sugar phosphate isomerase/epimerase